MIDGNADLVHMILTSLKEGAEVTFTNQGSGVGVKVLVRGAVNYSGSAEGGREHMGSLLKKAYNQLKTSLAKR